MLVVKKQRMRQEGVSPPMGWGVTFVQRGDGGLQTQGIPILLYDVLVYEIFDSKNEIFYTMSTQLVKHGSTAMFITSGQYAQVVDSLVRRVGNGQGQLEVRF